MEISKVIIPDNFNETIKQDSNSKWGVSVDNQSVKVNEKGELFVEFPAAPEVPTLPKNVLTCESINELEEVPWKKGTVLLAKQDGKCVRLKALESIFQEIGVGITANKVTAFTDESFDVTVTVTNTGEGKNDETELVINKPESGGFTIRDIRESYNLADSFEKVSEFTYKIKGLLRGGTFTVRFTVVPSEAKTFQFTASVNPNTALDLDGKNNNATLILSAYTKQDNTYVPSVDCPLITATELDHNAVLVQATPYNANNYVNAASYDSSNIFATRTSLKGLRINLENASTVVGYSKVSIDSLESIILSNNTMAMNTPIQGDGQSSSYIELNALAEKVGTDGYTFANGVLEVTKDLTNFTFACRPKGNNCRWQVYKLHASKQFQQKAISVTKAEGCTTSKKIKYQRGREINFVLSRILVIPNSVQILQGTVIRNTPVDFSKPVFSEEKLVIRVKAGTAATVEFTSTDNYADVSSSQGKTTISAGRVTVSADAKSTDSVNTPYIQVIVED